MVAIFVFKVILSCLPRFIILDVSDLSMDIWKEAAVLRQLFMILFAFYLQVDINNNTPSASGWMLPRYYAAKHMCYLVNIESP
jgi:hypothetical protein